MAGVQGAGRDFVNNPDSSDINMLTALDVSLSYAHQTLAYTMEDLDLPKWDSIQSPETLAEQKEFVLNMLKYLAAIRGSAATDIKTLCHWGGTRLGLSTRQLGNAASVSNGTVGRWLRAKPEPYIPSREEIEAGLEENPLSE